MIGTVGPEFDPRYVAARRVLLDALDALAPHVAALVVVGAQAIYLRTGGGTVGITPYTTDGDLALDPTLLGDDPQLEVAMSEAGFQLLEAGEGAREPGIWVANTVAGGERLIVPVDLIVPEGAATGGGRRGARLGPHGTRAARRARGLEAALIDHSVIPIGALEPDDPRVFEVDVAGTAAMFVAKAHKIHDRLASTSASRLDDKDAADVYRLMQHTSPQEIALRLVALRSNTLAGPATTKAIAYLEELFGRRGAPGTAMAARALRLAIPETQVATLATGYIARLREALG